MKKILPSILPYVVLLLLVFSGSVSVASTPSSPLIDAARRNDAETAAKLIQRGNNVNQTMTDGTTALHWAVYNGNHALVEQLIKAGANVNVKNDYGSSPMSEAAVIADAGIIKTLLKAGADVESPTLEGQTALMTVARTHHIDAAKLLIKAGADVNAREQWRNQTALMWASAQSQPEMVKLLIKYGADANARSEIRHWERLVTAEPRPQNRPPGGFTPLLLAAREGCAPCAHELVKGGADINLVNPDGITPLLMSTLNARWDVASALIKDGADVNRWDMWGRAPLYSTIDYSTVPRGGRPDRPSLDKTTPVDVAAMLLKAGANPNMQLKLFPPYRSLGADRGGDSMLTVGTTPLIRAAKGDDVPMVKLLLDYGADPNLKNWPGHRPITAVAGLGSTTIDTRARFRNEQEGIETAKLLLAAGADINASDDDGRRAIHGAAMWGWNDFIQFLIDNGADLNAKDNYGMTALDTAMGHSGGTGRFRQNVTVREETVTFLKELGAVANPNPN